MAVKAKLGAAFTDKAFVSTAYEKSVAETFMREADDAQMILTVVIPKGTRLIKMSGHSPNDMSKGESELLLNRGSSFERAADGTYRLVS